VIAGFEKQGLVAKTRSQADARVSELALTDAGRATFEVLNLASRNEVTAMLGRMTESTQQQLVDAMTQIEALLGESTPSYILRDPQAGDMGWVVRQQAVLYTREYGWNSEFEALVAEIVAKYLRDYDPSAERCWIAEKDGKAVGSVFVVRHDAETAQLRMLYVDASARGLGIGHRLVDECLRFARGVGYKRMMLWTNDILTDARKIYEKAGFTLVEEEAHHSFGKDLVGQIWARDL
jgi:GNAT superfamily N-acetyltransferase